MVNLFNYAPSPSVMERSKRRPQLERMLEAKGALTHIDGTFRNRLDQLAQAVDPDPKLSCAIEVDAASRIVEQLKADLAEAEHWIRQYTVALSEMATGGKSTKARKASR